MESPPANTRLVFIEELAVMIGKSVTTIRTCSSNQKYHHLIPRPRKLPNSRRLCWTLADVLSWIESSRPAEPPPLRRPRGRPTKAEQLARELPNIKNFATLSPIPGLRRYVDDRLKTEGDGALTAGEVDSLAPVTDEAAGAAAVRNLLDRPNWWEVPAIDKVLRAVLTRMAATYLTSSDDSLGKGGGRALDRVAHFHLGNGAIVERLNSELARALKSPDVI